ncbi:MAG: DoxX family protein [Pseudomonadota bacterium]
MDTLKTLSTPVARLLLAAIFILAGINKLGAYEGTMQYMEAFGVPGGLLPLVIVTEIGLGLAVALGVFTRLAALGLAGFSVISAVIFHSALGDQMQFVLFMKNIAITGGFLLLWIHGPGAYALDNLSRVGRITNRLQVI